MSEHDTFIRRCIELSQVAVDAGDAPFGSLIVKDGEVLAEASNDKNSQTNHHAEILALNKASEVTGSHDLFGCTLYTNVEPCPMCAFMIREYKIERVVFSLPSPFMGGYSKWNILEDVGLEEFPPYFGKCPEVVGSVLEPEARAVLDQTPLWMFGSQARER